MARKDFTPSSSPFSAQKSGPRVAIYARVSTSNNQDPETQLLALREYVRARGFDLVDEYVDVGISGSKERRPAPFFRKSN